jgi:hypothetical protein
MSDESFYNRNGWKLNSMFPAQFEFDKKFEFFADWNVEFCGVKTVLS